MFESRRGLYHLGFSGSSPIPTLPLTPNRVKSKAPSLHRHYPASTVLRASPPPHTARPVSRELPVDNELPPSPLGFPVLRCVSVYRHAVVNTPVARWALIARGTAYSNRFPVPSGGGLPYHRARSATTLDFSRPAQRSLAITACRLAESSIATRLSLRLRRFRFLPASLR